MWQCDWGLLIIFNFNSNLKTDIYSSIRNILSVFGTTWVCESTYSDRVSNDSLAFKFRCAVSVNYTVDFKGLVWKKVWNHLLQGFMLIWWRSNNILEMLVEHLFLFTFLFLNWGIIALQYCVGLCHTSTWISLRYTEHSKWTFLVSFC